MNGACNLLENRLKRNILFLGCRHHIAEIILSTVFQELFPPSSGPDIQIFKRFKNEWPKINATDFKNGL